MFGRKSSHERTDEHGDVWVTVWYRSLIIDREAAIRRAGLGVVLYYLNGVCCHARVSTSYSDKGQILRVDVSST